MMLLIEDYSNNRAEDVVKNFGIKSRGGRIYNMKKGHFM